MPGTGRVTPTPPRRRAGRVGRPVHRTGSASAHQVGQRQRVHCHRRPDLAWPDRREDALHCAGLAMGERLQRELQRLASRRAAQRRDLLQPRRGQGADRAVAPSLQHRSAAQQPGLPPAGPGSGDTAIAGLPFRFAPPPAGDGGGDNNALLSTRTTRWRLLTLPDAACCIPARGSAAPAIPGRPSIPP